MLEIYIFFKHRDFQVDWVIRSTPTLRSPVQVFIYLCLGFFQLVHFFALRIWIFLKAKFRTDIICCLKYWHAIRESTLSAHVFQAHVVKVVLWLYNLLIRVPNRFLSDPYESNVIDMRISAPVSTII